MTTIMIKKLNQLGRQVLEHTTSHDTRQIEPYPSNTIDYQRLSTLAPPSIHTCVTLQSLLMISVSRDRQLHINTIHSYIFAVVLP